jgi:transcriptional regulator with XRE-family HTH domain
MSQSFGARLRQRREAQRIALTTIARQTKIKLSLLDALERDDLSHWPAGLYRRAFIRAYAQAIGLDPDVTARELAQVHPELEQLPAEAAPAATNGDSAEGPASRLRMLVGSAFSRLRSSPPAEPPRAVETPRVAADEQDLDFPELAEALSEPVPLPLVRKAIVEAVVEAAPAAEPLSFEPDLPAIARLCTQVCRVERPDEVKPLLQEAARILDATGVIVWLWDEAAGGLRAALSHGYSDRMVAQLPAVRRDADNATAATFRTAHLQAIQGALVLPLIVPGGCAGVLAIELPDGREQTKAVRAVATIFAALLAQLVGGSRPDEVDAHAAVPAPEPDPGDDDRSGYARATLTH